jgi:zinc transporter, ZIP family
VPGHCHCHKSSPPLSLPVQIYISVCELIPTALKYDPHNHVTSKGIVIGMVVMAVSLLMFTI